MTTFTKIKEAVDFLVSRGIQEPFAKVAMDQNYNCDSGQEGVPYADRILCDLEAEADSDTQLICTEQDILDAWDARQDDDMIMTDKGIVLSEYDDVTDAESAMYDVNGDAYHRVVK